MTRAHCVVPLGVFGVLANQPHMDGFRQELERLADSIEISEREPIANYLRSGALVLAIMEYTRDILHNAFGVSGGSAMQTDGAYYWRRDAAEYVKHYGVALPDDFLQRGRRIGWKPTALSNEDILAIDKYLSHIHSM